MKQTRTGKTKYAQKEGSPLNLLPVELVREICRYLDNRSQLQLGIAWRSFLRTFVPSMDPWNNVRQRALREFESAGASFPVMLKMRFGQGTAGGTGEVAVTAFSVPMRESHQAFWDAWLEFLELDANSVVFVTPILIFVRTTEDIEWFRNISNQPVFSKAYRRTQPPLLLHLRWRNTHTESQQERIARQFRAWNAQAERWVHRPGISVARAHHLAQLLPMIANTPFFQKLEFGKDPQGQGNIDGECMHRIAEVLSRNTSVKELQLGGTFSERYSVADAVYLLEHSRLQTLVLDGCPWVGLLEGWSEAIAGNRNLKTLRLHSCVTDMEVEMLASGLRRNQTLVELSLPGNHITDAGAQSLAAMLEVNRSLRILDVGYCPIQEQGGLALVNALRHNPVLEILGMEASDVAVGAGEWDCVMQACMEMAATVQGSGTERRRRPYTEGQWYDATILFPMERSQGNQRVVICMATSALSKSYLETLQVEERDYDEITQEEPRILNNKLHREFLYPCPEIPN